jgi:hypothetical protein
MRLVTLQQREIGIVAELADSAQKNRVLLALSRLSHLSSSLVAGALKIVVSDHCYAKFWAGCFLPIA